MRGLAVLVLLQGCAFGQPFEEQPRQQACVQVNWIEPGAKVCKPGQVACATVGTGYSLSQIWARKPAAFDDHAAVCNLGHEFLHGLGATHKER